MRPAQTIAARALALALITALPAVSAAAETRDQATFDLSLRGLSAGSLSFSAARDSGSYAASGILKSGGLVAMVRTMRYEARASGSYAGGRHTPARYEEDRTLGSKSSQAVMDYRGGVPQVKVYNPPKKPRAGDLDPATQGGTVDPMTAIYAALRDVPRDEACRLKLAIFDGKRRSEVTVTDPKADGEGLVCRGEYRRVAGYSDEDMAEKSRFPFTMIYAPGPDGQMRVTEVVMETVFGNGRLTRR